MDIESPPDTAPLGALARAQAMSEAASLMGMVRHRDVEQARIEADPSPIKRLLERGMISLEIGQAMGLSEQQVNARLAMADRMIERAPGCWAAFVDGLIDAARVREISTGLDRLERESSWALDRKSVV